MIEPLIEVPEQSADELVAELEKAGASVSVHREDRYFGDANTVVLALGLANSLIGIAASAINIWTSKKQVSIKINGQDYIPNKSPSDRYEKIIQMLSQ